MTLLSRIIIFFVVVCCHSCKADGIDYHIKYLGIRPPQVGLLVKSNPQMPHQISEHINYRDADLIDKENHLHSLYLLFSTGIVLMAIAIIFILWRSYKASKANVIMLDNGNKQIIDQNKYLHQTLQNLEQSQEENNRLIRIITHDLRSPISAIVGLSNFMIDEHNLNEDDLEAVTVIHKSSIDSLNFINEILDRKSLTAGLKKESVELDILLKYCTLQLQYKATEKRQIISLHTIPLILFLNREKIWRVINNLITNAIKFSDIDSSIIVSLTQKEKKAIISIQDSGIGIPKNLKNKIFNTSNEGKRIGTIGEKSYGLGLKISKEIIVAHGGNLSFKSEVGKGTTFFVELPIEVL